MVSVIMEVFVESEDPDTEYDVVEDIAKFVRERMKDYFYDNYDYATDVEGPEADISWAIYTAL